MNKTLLTLVTSFIRRNTKTALILVLGISAVLLMASITWYMALNIRDYKPYPVCTSERGYRGG